MKRLIKFAKKCLFAKKLWPQCVATVLLQCACQRDSLLCVATYSSVHVSNDEFNME